MPQVVWLASYPRAGVTYVRHVIERIYGLPTYTVYPGEARITGMHEGDMRWPDDADESLPVHFVKVHDADFASRVGLAIHVVRDGRDTLISYAHFQREIAENPLQYNTILDQLLNGEQAYYHWGLHTLAWASRNVPRIVYSQLIADPIGTVVKAVDALRLPLQADTTKPLESFGVLQSKRPHFFRRGRTGEWREALGDEQLKRFHVIHGNAQAWFEYVSHNGKSENEHAVRD